MAVEGLAVGNTPALSMPGVLQWLALYMCPPGWIYRTYHLDLTKLNQPSKNRPVLKRIPEKKPSSETNTKNTSTN